MLQNQRCKIPPKLNLWKSRKAAATSFRKHLVTEKQVSSDEDLDSDSDKGILDRVVTLRKLT